MKNYEACIAALDAERSGDWERAHQLVGNLDTPEAAWVHAYLHRVEGDLGNAGYWYARADKPQCQDSLEMEWTAIRTRLSAGA
ncbi:MAG: hypothetical protein EA353_08245 [Puniceicoccaceae bacterium]|nr:MAG: hypothetical protein EA353_08245 [Puniceicoccaceae bacterium]